MSKPTAIKILEGCPGHRPINTNEPEYENNVEPPVWLDQRAVDEWHRLAPQLMRNKLLTDAEVAIFSAYCQAYSDVARLTVEIRSEGEVSPDRSGGVKRNPKCVLKQQAMVSLLDCIQKLGFSPISRSKIVVESTGEQKNPFAKYAG